MMKIPYLAVLLMLVVFTSPSVAEFCKWVDENGATHYAETCPENIDSTEIVIQAPPPQEQVEEVVRSSEQLLEKRKARNEKRVAAPSLSLDQLGPLPDSESSEYLTTTGTGILMNTQELVGQISISLKAKPRLPRGAYLEAYFPNPVSPSNPAVIGEVFEIVASEVVILSPESKGFKCWNYEVVVFVYRDTSKGELLGIHHQTVQARVDMNKVRNVDELLMAMAHGNCPAARTVESVRKLDALCEQERERRIAPLREAEIKKCNAREHDPEYCERYWSNYGEGGISSGGYIFPRMYDNLRVCVEARKARQEANRR